MLEYSSVECGTLAEQLDETHYDSRIDADDDLEKGRIKFASTRERLYGREEQLKQLEGIYNHQVTSQNKHQNLLVTDGLPASNEGHSMVEDVDGEEPVSNDEQLEQEETGRAPLDANVDESIDDDKGNDQNRTSSSPLSQIVFLAGYSGTGKSTLVDSFVQRIRQQRNHAHGTTTKSSSSSSSPAFRSPLHYLSGKFAGPMNAGAPFSALAHALNQFVVQLVATKRSSQPHHQHHDQWIRSFLRRLRKLEIYAGSDHAAVLEKTLLPALPRLLQKATAVPKTSSTTMGSDSLATGTSSNNASHGRTLPDDSSNASATTDSPSSMNMNLVQYAFQNFLRALSTTSKTTAPLSSLQPPLILFLDDVQWADAASLQLLSSVLLDSTLSNILFVLAYRSNEVDQNHEFMKLRQKVQEARGYTQPDDEPVIAPTTPTTTMTPPLPSSTLFTGVHYMELFNLSPDSIAEFIADSIEKTPEDVSVVADAIYQKTLGNIFFVKQALEELVRKNALYYDMVMFEWQFGDVSRVELEQFLSEDVLEMVQSKIKTMPQTLQKAMVLAAYTSQSTIELSLLQALLEADDSVDREECSHGALQSLMNRAFMEGLMLRDKNRSITDSTSVSSSSSSYVKHKMGNGGALRNGNSSIRAKPPPPSPFGRCTKYQFAHDRIREAACASVPAGREREELLLRISQVLLKQSSTLMTLTAESSRVLVHRTPIIEGSETDKEYDDDLDEDPDWMLFTAARHLNSISPELTHDMNLPNLNLTAGKIAVSKGAFNEALIFLQAGVDRLDPSSCWKEPTYTLSLELKVTLAETEQMLGHNEKTLDLAKEIFQSATSLADKSRVHHCYLEATNSLNNNDYGLAVDTAVDLLKLYNIELPGSPERRQIRREKMMLRFGLRGRSLLCVAKFPVATDQLLLTQVVVASRAMLYSLFCKRSNLSLLLGYRMLRIILRNKFITKEVPSCLVVMGGQLRENRKYESAFLFANAAIALMDRFPNERGLGFFRAKLGLYASLFCLRQSFRDCIEQYLDLYKWGYSQGETENGLGAAMCAMYSFMIASFPLNALFEPKLILFEEMALNRGRKNFSIIFRLIRQYLYNLQGGEKASTVPSHVNGEAITEEEALGMLEGPVRKQNLRDISMIRLELSVIFDDEESMREMVERLDEYPLHDVLTARQHLRMTYTGFACLILLQKRPPRNAQTRMMERWAKQSLKFFEELARFGSPNAQTVYACMKALQNPSVSSFDEAIQVCGNAGLFNLTAFMNERCGLMLMEQSQNSNDQNTTMKADDGSTPSYETYLKCAFWFYHDWGAMGKVSQLKSRFECLKNAMKEKAPSQLSSLRRQAAKLGLPRSGTTTSTISDS